MDKTKDQLKRELAEMRRRLVKLEKLYDEHKQLKERVKTLSSIVEVMGDALMLHTVDGEITFVNRAFENLAGYKRSELVGKNVADVGAKVTKPEDVEKTTAAIEAAMKGETPTPAPITLVTKEGVETPILFTVSFVRDAKGKPSITVVVLKDITQLTKTEEKLKKYSKNLERMVEEHTRELRMKDDALESSINAVGIIDLEGRLIYVNPSLLSLWRYDSEGEVMGRIAAETFWESPKDVQEIIEALTSKGYWVGEMVAKRKDGSTFDAQLSASTVYDEAGKPIAMMASFIDITERKLAEQELEIQRERFKSIFNYSLEGIVTLDVDNNILDANLGFENIFGYKFEEVEAKWLDDLIVPERFYYTEAKELDQMASDGILGYETIRKRKDGTELNVSISAGPIRIGGETRGRFVIFCDITERKQAEEALRCAEKDWRSSFDSLEDVMIIIDKDYNIENMNESGLALLGKRREEVIGRKCYQVINDRETPGEYCPCPLAMMTKQVESIEHYEERFGKYFSTKSSPVFDENGEITKFVDLRRDITERKQAEEALRESEERYRTLVSLGTDVGEAIVMLQDNEQGEGMQIFMNDQWPRITGYSKEELLGMSFFDLVHPQDRQTSQQRHREKMSGEAMAGLFEMSIIRKDSSEIPIELTSAFTTYMGKYANVAYIRDITERKQMQEALARQEKLAVLGQLAGGVSHELRNPLGAIKNATYFLGMALEQPEPEVKETLEILDREVTTSEHIISSLLDFVCPRPPMRRKVDINDVVQEALSRITVPENIEVVSYLDETLPMIVADPDQLSQVFGNITLNAIQAMLEGGQLVIKSTVSGPEWVAVSLADTGIGISEENLGKLFEPLITSKAKGIGLGLTLVKTLVEKHGGTIAVKSEVGKGSTFTVRLPVGGKEEK